MRLLFTFFILVLSFQINSYSITRFTSEEIDSMLQITRYDTTQNKTKSLIYYNLFYNYLERGDLDSSFIFYSYLQNTLNRAKKEDIETYASFSDNLAWAFLMRNIPDSSLAILKRLEKVIVKKSFNKYIPDLYFGYGLVYWYTKDYANSLKYFFKVKSLLKKDEESKFTYALTLNYISDIFMQLKDFSLSAKYLKKAIVYSTANDLVEAKAYTIRNLGLYYLRVRDYKNAEKYLLKSMREFKSYSNSFDVIFLNYNYLIELYLETGNPDKASDYLNSLVTIDVDTMPEIFKVGFYKNMGKYYLERGVPQKAIIYFKKYIDHFDQHYFRDYEVYKYLGQSYYLLDQVKLGFYFNKKSFEVMDSTYSAKLKYSSKIYKTVSQEDIVLNNNDNANSKISDVISFSELRAYYLKSYKYYIIAGITLFIILIIFLIYKTLDYSRKYFVERNTVKKYHKRIKTLERSLAELDEFIEERSNMLQEEVDNSSRLKSKLKKIETELNFTLNELKQLKLEYSYTVKGPLSKLINYLDFLIQKHYCDENDILFKKIRDLTKRLKYLILFRYGNRDFSARELSFEVVNLKELVKVVLNIIADISVGIEYSVKENYRGDKFLVEINEKLFGGILYSLFYYFMRETGKVDCKVDLYEGENKVALMLEFYGKTFTDAEITFVSSEDIMNGTSNIKERSKRNNYYKLVEIFYLLKKLEYDVSVSYKENYFALTVSLDKVASVMKIDKYVNKVEISGNILMLGVDEEEKILYEKIFEEKSGGNKNYNLYWEPNVIDRGVESLESYNKKGIHFDLVLLKVKLLKNSADRYKEFIHNIRKMNKSFLDVNIVAIIVEYDEAKFSELENYFSGVLYAPFDINTFVYIVMANMKNSPYKNRF